ncbi:Ribosomal RNA small subunit methyltransferase E [Polaribacter huanghezhanensis]|uniref:16S rRNA (uracil(1498)-N(3))-methyltransferase n=1 Tax=Polaribacter huanghezhanensis TaxID=1354726 RepID=UPI00264882B1|nr:16S rRNA (uracil(1498)-N(3))-methyltransferase [Polaribacter huanghezhanensis]WKD86219.1 Ribosomal RNA small subunit methyltransferase E [Polaribacter huanghezhanensis]
MQLFYNKDISSTDAQFTFDKTESRHIVKVLRKKDGDILHITNGKNELFTVKIILANDKRCLVEILNSEAKQKPWNYKLHIAISPTKNNDRLEWFLEKATEIGIDEITPIICSNSERTVLKTDRLEKIVQSAMKQSLKFVLPKLNEPIKFTDFINQEFESDLFIAHCEELDKKSFAKTIKPKTNILILIGPEGDFSPTEIEKALTNKFIPVTLGESRLRTETAGIVAAQTVALINELSS